MMKSLMKKISKIFSKVKGITPCPKWEAPQQLEFYAQYPFSTKSNQMFLLNISMFSLKEIHSFATSKSMTKCLKWLYNWL